MNLVEHQKKVEKQILRALHKTGLNYASISRETGVSISWLMKFKNGRLDTEPKPSQLQPLFDYLVKPSLPGKKSANKDSESL